MFCGSIFEKLPLGTQPFRRITPANALMTLRSFLIMFGTVDAEAHRCHDIRRGHARDLQHWGRTLYEILTAGEWRSPAFLDYLDVHELECGAVVEAHLGEST